MKHIEVVAAIIREGQEVLATQRGYGDYEGWWEFPGGKMEEGETREEALVREIREELCIGIAVEQFVCTVEYDYPPLADGRACSCTEDSKQALGSARSSAAFHLTMHCFLCGIVEGTLRLTEHKSAQWLNISELDSVEWLPADVEVIKVISEKYI